MMKKLLLSVVFMWGLTLVANADNYPYMAKVYDFQPAPGQFINALPNYLPGNTKEDMIAKVEQRLVKYYDDEDSAWVYNPKQLISLGGYGGYIVFGFDHPVVNVPDEYDFKIEGNAFQAASSSTAGGSSEPGIVMVSQDLNHNGIPDDPWYELAGSEYNNPRTQHNYVITYYRPDDDKTATPSKTSPYLNDTTYIRWTSNDAINPDSVKGYMSRNTFHSQSYWPEWLSDSVTLTFSGTKLPCNATDESGNGSYWVQRFYDWGYVDNRPNSTDPGFKIDWAVDADGKAVTLDHVDFIKVYSAVNQYCGWLGETSTEVTSAEDLHPQASGIDAIAADASSLIMLRSRAGSISLRNSGAAAQAVVYSLGGAAVSRLTIPEGDSSFDLSGLAHGVYVLRTSHQAVKFVR